MASSLLQDQMQAERMRAVLMKKNFHATWFTDTCERYAVNLNMKVNRGDNVHAWLSTSPCHAPSILSVYLLFCFCSVCRLSVVSVLFVLSILPILSCLSVPLRLWLSSFQLGHLRIVILIIVLSSTSILVDRLCINFGSSLQLASDIKPQLAAVAFSWPFLSHIPKHKTDKGQHDNHVACHLVEPTVTDH